MKPIRPAAAAAAVLVLALPAAAEAKTKAMLMGTPPATAKVLQKTGVDVNAYFPSKVTIHAGDSIRFNPVGFHTADLPAKGQKALPLLTPSGQAVGGAVDAAGAPFWFNGQPAVGFNPALLPNLFGKKKTYTGAKRVESGLPFSNRPRPMTVKFSKTGSYTVYCDVHPGMKGTVKVVKASKSIPTVRQDAQSVKKQVDAAKKTGKGLASKSQPANTVSVGVAGKGGVEYFGMVPKQLTVARGTAVKFTMSSGSYEAHTATFGPGPIDDPKSYLGALAATFESPAPSPQGVYPSDVTPVSLSPALHGNGFWNSGALDRSGATPLPPAATVTFGAPGTYAFYCLIHPFMTGSIVVT